jgi:murein DD-endopeptidase MepM/ murein hydrolase activator NlpD
MRWFIFFSIVFLSEFIFSQQKFSFPIDTVDITGNFGEIRNNHFHQGLDFSTKGKENYPVKSISDGYIYRIKVSPSGFGKVLYIHHPNGLLSVYAHLNSFSEKIEYFITRKFN